MRDIPFFPTERRPLQTSETNAEISEIQTDLIDHSKKLIEKK